MVFLQQVLYNTFNFVIPSVQLKCELRAISNGHYLAKKSERERERERESTKGRRNVKGRGRINVGKCKILEVSYHLVSVDSRAS